MIKNLQYTTFGIFLLWILQLNVSCVPLLVGTIAVTAIDIAIDRRTIGRHIDDNALELKLRKDILFDNLLASSVHINVTSINGIVLFTGEVQKNIQRQRVVALALSYPETRHVVNEIALSGTTNINSRANDAWITGKVKTQFFSKHGIPASNIKVITERGNVYLLGLVTHSEGDRAAEIAKSIGGVTHIYKVFEYIDS